MITGLFCFTYEVDDHCQYVALVLKENHLYLNGGILWDIQQDIFGLDLHRKVSF